MKVLSTDGLTKLIQLVKSAFISVDDTETTTEIDTVTTSEVTLATVATSGSYNNLTDKPDLTTKADVDLSNINTSGKSFASGLAMPSSRYIDLTLGASGTQYTAPANGYVSISKQAGFNGAALLRLGNNTAGIESQASPTGDWVSTGLFVPVKEGDEFQVDYNLTGQTWFFRFVYAEGEE